MSESPAEDVGSTKVGAEPPNPNSVGSAGSLSLLAGLLALITRGAAYYVAPDHHVDLVRGGMLEIGLYLGSGVLILVGIVVGILALVRNDGGVAGVFGILVSLAAGAF